jgi:hypothetical protein
MPVMPIASAIRNPARISITLQYSLFRAFVLFTIKTIGYRRLSSNRTVIPN